MNTAVIGDPGRFHVQIRRHNDLIAKTDRTDMLNDKVPMKFALEITNDGFIALYSSYDPFTPLITAHDPSPLPIKYMSFASKDSLVQYYFMCTDDIKDISYEQPIIRTELPSRFGENLVSGMKGHEAGAVTHKYDLQLCKHVQVQEYEYRNFIPLKDIVGEHYENQVINLPLLIQGGKNAHIALTSTDKPNWDRDNIYEFLIGGWDNSRIFVRRAKNSEVLEEEDTMSTINKIMPTKFTISITPAGKIFLFSEMSAYKPLIWTSDPDPLPIKYISFASDQSEVIDFYYGCPEFAQQLPMMGIALFFEDKSLVKKPISLDVHPLLENPLLYDDIDLKALAYYSRSAESWTESYDSFIFVKDAWRPRGFMLRFIVYVQSMKGAHILLSTEPKITVGNHVYEIRLGSQGNTLSQIVRKNDSEVLVEIHEQNVLSEYEPLRVIVQISNGKHSVNSSIIIYRNKSYSFRIFRRNIRSLHVPQPNRAIVAYIDSATHTNQLYRVGIVDAIAILLRPK